jgi:hypothetical protein
MIKARRRVQSGKEKERNVARERERIPLARRFEAEWEAASSSPPALASAAS